MSASITRQFAGNPFSTRWVRPGAVRYIFPDGSGPEQLVETFRNLHWQGQIVGPHGSGKSTLLAALTPHLEAAGRSIVRLEMHDGRRRTGTTLTALNGLRERDVLAIDGYEQIGFLMRAVIRLACRRRGAGLLVTVHEPVRLPLLLRTAVDPALALRIVESLHPGMELEVCAADVSRCFEHQRGNMRETLFELYDVYERRRLARDVTSGMIR